MLHLRNAKTRRFGRDERGAAMVEFAIIAPVLLLLVFGIVDFGRYFFLYNNLTNSAREGARLGAVSAMGTSAEIAATRATVIGSVRGKIMDQHAATANVQFGLRGTAPNQTVRVDIIAYPFARAVPWLVPITLPDVRAEFRYEFQ
jgi:Flp pilus assembly protein TadG